MLTVADSGLSSLDRDPTTPSMGGGSDFRNAFSWPLPAHVLGLVLRARSTLGLGGAVPLLFSEINSPHEFLGGTPFPVFSA